MSDHAMNPKNPEQIRILHTADWHLGREFHGADLSEAHQEFFDWLTERISELEIDLVVMAGDIFDRALPPVKAIELFNRNVDRLAALAPIVLISGNHDSAVRMGYGPLLREGLTLRSGVESIGDPVIFENGPFPLAIYPIPYLDPITSAPGVESEEATHHAVLKAAVAAARRDFTERPENTRAIAMGHAFIAGGETSESERGINIGGSDQVPANVFEGFDYVALGHLHRPQMISETIRYSGSPLHLSFSEVGAEKSVVVLDLSADGTITTQTVPVPSAFRVLRLKGELEDLLNSPAYEEFEDDWLEIELTDRKRPDSPKERLDRRFRHLLHLRFSAPVQAAADREAEDLERLARQEPIELVSAFIEHVRGEGPDEQERRLLREAIESRAAEDVRS
jgi:DNA repair protein SbcD/Mre11